MSLVVTCRKCGADYDMDFDPPLDDDHESPTGQPCTATTSDWNVEETD